MKLGCTIAGMRLLMCMCVCARVWARYAVQWVLVQGVVRSVRPLITERVCVCACVRIMELCFFCGVRHARCKRKLTYGVSSAFLGACPFSPRASRRTCILLIGAMRCE
jgi:hypothetical protein